MVQGPNGEPFWDEVSDFARNSWSWAHEAGILSDASHPGDTLTKEEFMVHLKRYHGSVQGALQSGGISEHRVKELIEADTTHLRAGRPIVGRNA